MSQFTSWRISLCSINLALQLSIYTCAATMLDLSTTTLLYFDITSVGILMTLHNAAIITPKLTSCMTLSFLPTGLLWPLPEPQLMESTVLPNYRLPLICSQVRHAKWQSRHLEHLRKAQYWALQSPLTRLPGTQPGLCIVPVCYLVHDMIWHSTWCWESWLRLFCRVYWIWSCTC